MMDRREFLMSLLGGGAIIGAGARRPEIPDEDAYEGSLNSAPRDLVMPFRVIGLGGAGCRIVHDIAESKRQDVQVIAIDTDARVLEGTAADEKVLIGRTLMNGRGNLVEPKLGRQAALEDLKRIASLIEGAGTVVVVAGLGGGTGTGAIMPVVRLARKTGAFVPVVVTRPFGFEGEDRAGHASDVITALGKEGSAVLVISNDRLLAFAEKSVRVSDVFKVSDRMVLHAVAVFRDAMQGGAAGIRREDMEGLFSGSSGRTVMGVGYGRGEICGAVAALNASYSPLLDRRSIAGAGSAYVHVEGGNDLTMEDIRDAVEMVTRMVSTKATVRFGVVHNPSLDGSVAVTVLATGFPGRKKATAHELETVPYWDEPWSEKV